MLGILGEPKSTPTCHSFGVGAHHDLFCGNFEPCLALLYTRAILTLLVSELVAAPQSGALLGRLLNENEKIAGLGHATGFVRSRAYLNAHVFEKVNSR